MSKVLPKGRRGRFSTAYQLPAPENPLWRHLYQGRKTVRKDDSIHARNMQSLAEELRRMSRLEPPYDVYFADVPPLTRGIRHLAAFYLDGRARP